MRFFNTSQKPYKNLGIEEKNFTGFFRYQTCWLVERDRGMVSRGLMCIFVFQEAKKRGRSGAASPKKAEGESPAKRGRGRPKGSGKKSSKAAKAKVKFEPLTSWKFTNLPHLSW